MGGLKIDTLGRTLNVEVDTDGMTVKPLTLKRLREMRQLKKMREQFGHVRGRRACMENGSNGGDWNDDRFQKRKVELSCID